MVKCKCTFAIRMLGEGCRYCQPQEYIDRMHEQMADEQVERDAALAMLEEVSYRLRHGKVWAGMSWTYTPIHPTKLMMLAEKVDALLASQSPKESTK